MDSSEDASSQRMIGLDVDPNDPFPPLPLNTRKAAMIRNSQSQSQSQSRSRARMVPGSYEEEFSQYSKPRPKSSKKVLIIEPVKAPSQQGRVVRNESQARGMLPLLSLPACLNPGRAERRISRTLPTCWYGVPYLRSFMVKFARECGCVAYKSAASRAIDDEQTWKNVQAVFYEQSQMEVVRREVHKLDVPLLTFWSNLDSGKISKEHALRARVFLTAMGYDNECPMMWYLDKRESL